VKLLFYDNTLPERLSGVQSDLNQGAVEAWSLPCSAEGVEPREQQQQGSEPREGAAAGRQEGRGWWRRASKAEGEADRGSSRGWRSRVVQWRRNSNRGAAPTLGDQKRIHARGQSFILTTVSAPSHHSVSRHTSSARNRQSSFTRPAPAKKTFSAPPSAPTLVYAPRRPAEASVTASRPRLTVSDARCSCSAPKRAQNAAEFFQAYTRD
jgi:hypothetical protein